MAGGIVFTIAGLVALLIVAGEVMVWMCTAPSAAVPSRPTAAGRHAPDAASGAIEGGVFAGAAIPPNHAALPDPLDHLRGTGAL
jgi:hypothetical protein